MIVVVLEVFVTIASVVTQKIPYTKKGQEDCETKQEEQPKVRK